MLNLDKREFRLGRVTLPEFLGEKVRTTERGSITSFGPDEMDSFVKAIRDPSFADEIAIKKQKMGRKELRPIDCKLARKIMGKNFWGIEEWSSFYGLTFTDEQRDKAQMFPWGEDILNAPCPFMRGNRIRETHFAFLGVPGINGDPLTVLKWQEIHDHGGQPKFDSFYNPRHLIDNAKNTNQTTILVYHTFALTETVCDFQWHLILLEIVPTSTNKKYKEQIRKLPKDYEAPMVIEEVTKSFLHYMKNGIYLNRDKITRCDEIHYSNLNEDWNKHYTAGNFGEDGIIIQPKEDWYDLDFLGIGASRMPYSKK